MDAKSFIKIGLFSVSIPVMNIGSAFGWECSAGHSHESSELLCEETGDRLCKVPGCRAVFHTKGKFCPGMVIKVPSKDIEYAVLPWCVPDEKIDELWFEYGCNNEEKDKMCSVEFNFDQNSEINRLETQIQALKEELRKSSPEYLKKQERLKKLNAFMLKRREEYEAERNKMLSKENMERIKQEEACVKQKMLDKSLKRKEALQSKKEKKNGE